MATVDELEALTELIEEFSKEMTKKLYYKHFEGYRGWATETPEFFKRRIMLHIAKGIEGQEVDIAALCAMHLRVVEENDS